MNADTTKTELETLVTKSAVPHGMGLHEFLSKMNDAAIASIRSAGLADSDNWPGYVIEVYEDVLIFCAYKNDMRSHYKASWKLEDGEISFGEWREVIEVTQFVEVRKARWQSRSIFDSLF